MIIYIVGAYDEDNALEIAGAVIDNEHECLELKEAIRRAEEDFGETGDNRVFKIEVTKVYDGRIGLSLRREDRIVNHLIRVELDTSAIRQAVVDFVRNVSGFIPTKTNATCIEVWGNDSVVRSLDTINGIRITFEEEET